MCMQHAVKQNQHTASNGEKKNQLQNCLWKGIIGYVSSLEGTDNEMETKIETICTAKKTASPPSANGAPQSVLGRIRMGDPAKAKLLIYSRQCFEIRIYCCVPNSSTNMRMFKEDNIKLEQPPGYLETSYINMHDKT